MGRDAITGLVVLAASLALFWASLGLERHPMVPVGPGFYPRIVLGITALFAVILVVRDVLAHRRGRAAAGRSQANYLLVAIAFAIFALYVFAMPYLGFRLSTLAFLLAMPLVLERPRNARGWVAVIVVAILGTAVTYFVFERYLQVLMPRGRWTGF